MDVLINNLTEYQLDNYHDVVERAAREAYAAAGGEEKDGKTAVASVSFVTTEEIQNLNRRYRGVDSCTDVLSFPAGDEDGEGGAEADGKTLLGDVIICFDQACVQAREYGNTNKRELAFLVTHGILHLMGHDHDEPEAEALMLALQKETIKRLEI